MLTRITLDSGTAFVDFLHFQTQLAHLIVLYSCLARALTHYLPV